ncbi:sodium:solute symporter family transporter [Deinococcus hopiensis]|uniref:sodium:solute symporter family transporter n=1 Tax=Deinococcus hopiensis TaxID=309885 RepID=UPI001FE53D46|nr:hypothetical protein [Deinococcus hopiensis]
MTFLLRAITLGTIFWASRHHTSVGDSCVAGGRISAAQNGIAIAGNHVSAASFLGITDLIALNGYGSFMSSVGRFTAYLTELFVVAEPLRKLGKSTLADMLVYRLRDPGYGLARRSAPSW